MSTAIRTAPGTSSCRRPNCFATSSPMKKLIPVALPPGRPRLGTRPSPTGSSGTAKTMGIVEAADFAASTVEMPPPVAITATCRRTSRPPALVRDQAGSRPIGIRSRRSRPRHSPSPSGPDEPAQPVREPLTRLAVKDIQSPASRAARARRERPRRHRTAEHRDELAPLHHSITSSARASNEGGTSRPRALAVFRLRTSSNLVGRITGSSAGLAPFRISPT